MYDQAIACARILNPTWGEDRNEELPWGEIGHRPYLRGLLGRAVALKDSGKRIEAIAQAKKLIRLNPNDNQGIRQPLCTWFLEARDTEGCTNLLRKYGTNGDTSLAYADLLLQYLRWKKDDAVENDVKQALYVSLKANPFVPDLLGVEGIGKDNEDDPYYSPGSLKDAKIYVVGSQKLWEKFPECIDWIKAQKFVGAKVPSEGNLIDLLKSGTNFQLTCVHTALDGNDFKESTISGTQKRNKCRGCALESFHWPRRLNRPHEPTSDVLFHNNDSDEPGWRKTKYTDISEVPYWRIFLQFYEEDAENTDDLHEEVLSMTRQQQNQPARPEITAETLLKCKMCSSPGKFCALDNDCSEFYCSKACMKNFLDESEPPYFDLQAPTLKVHVPYDCSICTVSLDDAFRVAGEHMPNLNSVDIFVNQDYVIKEEFGFSGSGKNLLLSPSVLEQFFEKVKIKLVSFSLRLDDCCWEEFKRMTNRCRALVSLGSLPNLKKLDLTNFGFDDVGTLTSCLSTGLEVLSLDYVKMGPTLEWSASEMNVFVASLTHLTSLVSLSLADSAITDRHLKILLPRLHSLKCLDVSGTFGSSSNGMFGNSADNSKLTDHGLKAIADHCPNIVSLFANYQHKMTMAGIRVLLQKCPDLVALQFGEVDIGPQHIQDVLTTPKKLLFLMFGKIGARDPTPQEKLAVQNAVQATNGRAVVSTISGGPYAVTLSPVHRRKWEESMAKINKSDEQERDPLIMNCWDGLI